MANAKINFEDEQVRKIYRHTTSHILAQAVKHIWPDVKLAIGPAIDNGYRPLPSSFLSCISCSAPGTWALIYTLHWSLSV